MRKSRLFALLAALAMAVSALPAAALAAEPEAPVASLDTTPLVSTARTYEGTLSDVAGAWCEDAVKTVYETGLMEGKTAERFDITSSLTNAQITVVTARLHALLNGGDGVLPAAEAGSPWYQPAVDYLREQSADEELLYLLKELETEDNRANSACVRLDFVRMLSAILPEDALSPINDIAVVPDVTPSETSVLAFYRAGVLNGSDAYGTFGEDGTLTRGAAAAILARLVDPSQRLCLTLAEFDLCRDVLGVEPETVLLTVNGTEISAALFAEQLCTSLYQRMGGTESALEDAIRFWCQYRGCFRVLAEELGVSLSEEEQAAIRQSAQLQDGYLGLSAAYWQFCGEGDALNQSMNDQYYEQDWKHGVSSYHSALEKTAESMVPSAVPAAALASMDLQAVYQRLMRSPFPSWRGLNRS